MPFALSSTELILTSLVGVLILWLAVLEWRIFRLTRGAQGKSLEQLLSDIQKEYVLFKDTRVKNEERLKNLHERLKHAVRGVSTVRFNPFANAGGGKHSFASAFVSESGDGVILSTLNARDRVSVFAKTVTAFKSEHELTDEESAALEKAKQSVHNALM